MDTPQKLSPQTILLHWLVALFVTVQLAGGFIMIGKIYSFYPIHKQIGVMALFVILARVLWRLKKGWPKPLDGRNLIEQRLARTVQWVLIISTIMMPLSGILASGIGGFGVWLFNFTIVPKNPSLINPEDVIPYSEYWMNMGYALHTWFGYTLAATIGLHISGALKHHLFDKDATLKRMLGKH